MPDDKDGNVWSAPELDGLVPNSLQRDKLVRAFQMLRNFGFLPEHTPRGSGYSTYRAMLAAKILEEKYPLYEVVPIVRDNEH